MISIEPSMNRIISQNQIMAVYWVLNSLTLRVTMFFSIFHFGQSLDIATWSPWQFTHFGSFWLLSQLCPSSPHPAHFWHWKHLWGLGMYGRVSFFRYPILIFFGIFCLLIVKTYRLWRMEILLTSMIPCGWSSCLISYSCILLQFLTFDDKFWRIQSSMWWNFDR